MNTQPVKQKTYKDLAKALVANLCDNHALWQAPVSPFYVVLRSSGRTPIKEISVRIIKNINPRDGYGRYIFEILKPNHEGGFWYTNSLDRHELEKDLERITKWVQHNNPDMEALYISERDAQRKPTYQDLADILIGDIIEDSITIEGNTSHAVVVAKGERPDNDILASIFKRTNGCYAVRVLNRWNSWGPRLCTETLNRVELANMLQRLTQLSVRHAKANGMKQKEVFAPVLTYKSLADLIFWDMTNKENKRYHFFSLGPASGFSQGNETDADLKDVRVSIEKDNKKNLMACIYEDDKRVSSISINAHDTSELAGELERIAAQYYATACEKNMWAYEWHARAKEE